VQKSPGAFVYLQTEPIPIHIYVEQCFHNRTIAQMINGWKVEPRELIDIILVHFRDMGIFFALPSYRDLILKNIIHNLKYSREITTLVKEVEYESLKRQQQNRHAEL